MTSNAGSNRTVVIDAFPESAAKYREDYAIVAVDVSSCDDSCRHRRRMRPALRGGP